MKYLVSLTALSFIPFSHAATIKVTAGATDTEINGNCSIIEAITTANTDLAADSCVIGNGADTIQIPAGRYVFDAAIDNAALPDITSPITLIGQGDKSWKTTLERSAMAPTAFRFIYLGHNYRRMRLSVENLHFKNGQATNGGAIYTAGQLNVVDSTFEKNVARSNEENEGRGGAIYTKSDNSDANLRRNTFLNNAASQYGGAVYLGTFLQSQVLTHDKSSEQYIFR